MGIYAIGDLHLSLGNPDKSMEVFGGRWLGYVDKIKRSFSELSEDDTLVLCGDTSWGMSLEAALEDFSFLQQFPCRKYLVKGNHDYWWTTAAKMNRFFTENRLDTFTILHNNAFPCEGMWLCGTRGWFYEEETGTEHDSLIMSREIGRLKYSLDASGEGEKLVFLHYPPLYNRYECTEILDELSRQGVRECCYGHLHGYGCGYAFRGEREGVHYRLVSADYLDFMPAQIL